MGLLLKQSTAVDLLVGPFVDDSDGKTSETGLTITQAEVRLSKNGGNMAQKNEATALSHDELGMYVCKLDATDTNTLGRLQVTIWESGALHVYHEFMVVTANYYDSVCGSDVLQSDLTQIGGVAQSATDLKDFADDGYDPATDKVQGVVLTDTTTTCTTTTTNTDLTAFAANYTAARAGYLDELAAANLPTDVANVKAETATILTDTNEIQGKLPTNKIMGSSDVDNHDTDIDAILVDTNELQTDWVNGGRLDLLIDAIKAITDTLVLATIADTIWDEVMDTNAPANLNSAREIMNITSSVLAGKSSGGGTNTIVFRDTGDTKNRISATVDGDGNRTAVGTQDGT